MNKKIIHVIESSATGTLSMLKLSVKLNLKKSDQVSIIYSKRIETPENFERLFPPTVNLIEVDMSSIIKRLKSIFKIRKILKNKKNDFVFMHSSYAGFLVRIASINIPGNYYYIPHCISFMRQDISFLKRKSFILAETLINLIKGSTYISCSKSEEKSIKANIPTAKTFLLENAVDTEYWKKSVAQKELENSGRIIITTGQIREQKNPSEFAAIANAIIRKRENHRFIWVGDGDENYKRELINSGVEVTGWKKPIEIRGLLHGANYYLSTSLWEGMPISPIEAMLSGCVPILSNCDGNSDIIENNETGIIYSTTQNAIDSILKLSENDCYTRKLSLAGKRNCEERFSEERYAKGLKKLMYERQQNT